MCPSYFAKNNWKDWQKHFRVFLLARIHSFVADMSLMVAALQGQRNDAAEEEDDASVALVEGR